MKKTLFAMMALATMLPAMAENVNMYYVYADPYEDILTPSEITTDYTKYSFYLTLQENTDLATVKTMLEGKTFSEFTTTLAFGERMSFGQYYAEYNQIGREVDTLIDLPTTLGIKDIWGVCVYQNEDVVRFQVLEAYTNNNTNFYYDTADIPGSSYTSFKADSPVPEPATATLSLLALAGLASRRRRH